MARKKSKPIDEIIVRGVAPKAGPGMSPAGITGRGGNRGEPQFTFLPPPLAPAVDEIIVTAKRQASLRAIGARALSALSWVGFVGVGIFSLDQYRRQLERELDEKSKRDAEERRQRRLAQEQPLPEITVRAQRPAALAPPALPAPLFLPPAPVFIPPDVDPGVMVPIEPVQVPVPQPQVAPPQVAPIAPPAIPAPLPAVAPPPGIVIPGIRPVTIPGPRTRPQTRPQTRPERRVRPRVRPQTQPAVSPAPAVQPQVFPAVRPAASVSQQLRARTRSLTRAQPRALSLAELSPGQGIKRCPPCAKERKEPRTECFKKLVKEHMFPDLDQTYEWVEIDCLTGRELD